jgi:creatinine amidohydrolase
VRSRFDVRNIRDLGAGEIRERLDASARTILVPLGSCERHGNPYTPIGIDSTVALALVERAASKADVLHAPEIAFGYAPHHTGRAGEGHGTVTLRASTYRRLVEDVVRSLVFQGFDRVVLVTLHTFNIGAVEPLLIPLRMRTGALVAIYGGRESDRVQEILGSAPGRLASDMEAALALALLGDGFQTDEYLSHSYEIVAPEWLGPGFDKQPGTGLAVSFRGSDNVVLGLNDYEFVRPVAHDSPQPSTATAEKGHELLDVMADDLAAFVEEIKQLEIEATNRELEWSES